jgi:hypothetical protein
MFSFQNIYNGQPIITELNNAALTGKNAMPMKDITSNNDSGFASDRKEFAKTHILLPGNSLKPPNFGPSGTSRILPTIYDGTHTPIQKKWIGGNRDASQIITNRRVNATATSFNPTGQYMAFVTKNDPNTVRDARHRVRSGGAIAPAKKTHKYTGAPVFY